MVLVTKNIDETLKMFGESITLHQMIFEKHNITYESKASYFWTNVCFNFLVHIILIIYIYNLCILYYTLIHKITLI